MFILLASLKSGMRDVEVLIRMNWNARICGVAASVFLCSCMPCIVYNVKMCRYEVPWGGSEKMASLKGGHVFSPDLLPTLIRDLDTRPY